jgi:predicted MFS family arabinose efflux permease
LCRVQNVTTLSCVEFVHNAVRSTKEARMSHPTPSPVAATEVQPPVTAAGHPAGGRRAWLITWLLLALFMINFADKAVLGLAHDAILLDVGITESQYGVISGAFFLLFSLSALAVGFLADRFPTKQLLLWMCLLWTVSVIPLLGPAVGFGLLLGCRVFLGAAEGPTFGVANHAIQKWFKDDQRNLPIAIFNLGATLGVILMARPLTGIIDSFGWRAAFATVAAIGVVWAVAWFFVGEEGPVGASPTTHDTEASLLAGRRVPLRRLVLSGTVLGALVASIAAYWSLSLLVSYVNPYLTEALGYSSGRASTLYALPWAMAGVVLIGQGVLARRLMLRGVSTRWARGGIAGAGLLLAALCTVGFLVTDGPLQIVLLTLAFSMSGMTFSVSSAVCGEIAPPQQRGTLLGVYVAISSFGAVASPPVMGRLLDSAATKADGYVTGFTVMAVILVIGGLAALLIRPERDASRLADHTEPAARASA